MTIIWISGAEGGRGGVGTYFWVGLVTMGCGQLASYWLSGHWFGRRWAVCALISYPKDGITTCCTIQLWPLEVFDRRKLISDAQGEKKQGISLALITQRPWISGHMWYTCDSLFLVISNSPHIHTVAMPLISVENRELCLKEKHDPKVAGELCSPDQRAPEGLNSGSKYTHQSRAGCLLPQGGCRKSWLNNGSHQPGKP